MKHVDWADYSVPVASTVNDNMSFSQAFSAARAEVGPGGAFEWHGQVYGTYTATEWNNMSSGARAEWGNHFHWDKYHSDYLEPQQTSPTSSDSDVSVVDYGTVDDGSGGKMDMAVVRVDGETGYVVDVDQDGVADYIMQDVNHDGIISRAEMTNVVDSDIAMSDLEQAHNDMLSDYASDVNIDGVLS